MRSKKELKETYDQNALRYDLVCRKAHSLLDSALHQSRIELLHVSHRVKSFESFYEKISRKKYRDPYQDIEDVCGIRAICFYTNDLPRIGQIIGETFDLSNTIDKISLLETDQFGYRSNHYVVRLPDHPPFAELREYKIEVQVRTVLMHTWAHIQGRLEYKQKEHTPVKFQRKLYQMSALLEMADEQFQALKVEKDAYRASLITTKSGFTPSMGLNIDSFMSFMEVFFPDRKGSYRFIKLLMKELIQNHIDFQQILKSYEKVEAHLVAIETELGTVLAPEDLLKVILAIAMPDFRNTFNEDELLVQHQKVVLKWSEKLKDN